MNICKIFYLSIDLRPVRSYARAHTFEKQIDISLSDGISVVGISDPHEPVPTLRYGHQGEALLSGQQAMDLGCVVEVLLDQLTHGGAHPLDVGVEATVGDLAGPGPVVTEARLLGADVADGSHRELLG